MKLVKSMSWIKPFTKASFSLYAGNVIDAFQPLDFFHFYPMWYDLWVKRIADVIKILDLEHKTYVELKEFLGTPSNMRAILQKVIPSYNGLENKNPADYKIVSNFFVRMLVEACPADPFGNISTPLYSSQEVEKLINQTEWQNGAPIPGRNLGKLITASGSLVHGLYNDLVTDFGWDAYGPFKHGDLSLLIRHFPNFQPNELWSAEFFPSVKELKIFGLYEGVEWNIACVGCHTIATKGSPVTDLKKYCVLADGKTLTTQEIEALILELSDKAEAIYKEIRKKDFEDLKKMVMLQECFQTKKIFDAASVDWRPTSEMLARIEGKPLLKNLIPHGKMMSSIEEYIHDFGVGVFAREVLEEKLD